MRFLYFQNLAQTAGTTPPRILVRDKQPCSKSFNCFFILRIEPLSKLIFKRQWSYAVKFKLKLSDNNLGASWVINHNYHCTICARTDKLGPGPRHPGMM